MGYIHELFSEGSRAVLPRGSEPRDAAATTGGWEAGRRAEEQGV